MYTILVQVPVTFKNSKQDPLQVFKLHTVPVPLDTDTYARVKHRYTKVHFQHDYLAIADEEFADIQQDELDSCMRRGHDFLCHSLHFTATLTIPSCAAAIYRNEPAGVIKNVCDVTFYEHLAPYPQRLETQDEILLAGFPSGWNLLCGHEADRPLPLNDSIYAVINRNDLCSCGLAAQHYFMRDRMRTCEQPDTKVTLYSVYNKALANYDPEVSEYDSTRLYKQLPLHHSPDITYGDTVSQRKRRALDGNLINFVDIEMPLAQAVNYMETGDIYELPNEYHCPIVDMQPTMDHGVFDTYDNVFDVVTIINSIIVIVNVIVASALYYYRLRPLALLLAAKHIMPPETTALDIVPEDNIKPLYKVNLTTTVPTLPASSDVIVWHVIVIVAPVTILTLFVILSLFYLRHFFCRLCNRSSLLRMTSPAFSAQNMALQPRTDIYLDIVYVPSGEQIRIFLTTVAAPPTSLSFSGAVKLSDFQLTKSRLFSEISIQWHNCLLHYNSHVIPLPSKGKCFSLQPDLLTDFSLPGPYHIQLLARQMDMFLQIPHVTQIDFVNTDSMNPSITPTNPYGDIQAQVRAMMPMADTPSQSQDSLSAIPEIFV